MGLGSNVASQAQVSYQSNKNNKSKLELKKSEVTLQNS